MSLFQCENCGCIENTACCHYHCRSMPNMTPPEYLNKELCCVCGPTHYPSGEPIEGAGVWHNRFPRRFLPMGEWVTDPVGNLMHRDTGDSDYSAVVSDISYNRLYPN